MRILLRLLVVLLWGAITATAALTLGWCTQFLPLTPVGGKLVHSALVWAIPLALSLGIGLAAFGLLPGTRWKTKILVRIYYTNGYSGYAYANALRLRPSVFRILSTTPTESPVTWQFVPGETVRCKRGMLSGGGREPVAIKLIA